ncbi:hypothetical protein AOY38_08315 [Synechocystis sp. PCC 6803]|nr:hypothetical protein AOY38_08315 [Synechocystis sp. PCC 6803]AVP89667.1 hypothetical protein C7I86_08310 [Synechocystis sp. IPPAS B-1465]BAM51928.1 hypothetical protein BEST7613_2997 [Synechocystis sp. PCC 6803] [Bacillus subtilis BEST7613]
MVPNPGQICKFVGKKCPSNRQKDRQNSVKLGRGQGELKIDRRAWETVGEVEKKYWGLFKNVFEKPPWPSKFGGK